MKKRILALILSIMMIVSLPSAIVGAYYSLPLDVGNFNDYGGGGDWGGGDDFGGGNDWGNDWGNDYDGGTVNYSDDTDSSDNIWIFLAVLGVMILVIALNAGKERKNRKTYRKPSQTSYTSRPIPSQYMPLDFTKSITEFIKKSDPDFSAEKFIAWSKNLFITLQAAWTERDWEKIRVLEKEELFELHNTQIQEYIRLGRINIIERINVNQAFLNKYTIDNNYENLTVCMNVRMVDYIIDEKSKKVLKGDPNSDVFMTYLLTFIRKRGVKTKIIDGVISSSCPHCGAPVDSASAGKCVYCGSIVHAGEFNWVLSDMQAVKPGMKNDSRGIVILSDDDNKQE